MKTEKLGNLIGLTKGKKHRETDDINASRYLQIEDVNGDDNIKYTKEKGVNVLPDDIILVWDGANAGKVGIGLNGIIGSTLSRMSLDNKTVFPKYLFWFLQSKFDYIKSQRTGATIPHVSSSAIRNLPIPIFPLTEQQRIANILNHADSIRRKNSQILEKYNELAQSVFYEMFGDPVLNPKRWKLIPVSEIMEVRGRVGWKGYKRTDLRESGPYVLGATHLTSEGEINLTDAVYISEEKYFESPEIIIEVGDIIFVQRGNTIGKIGLVKNHLGQATINPCVLILRPFNVNPLYFKSLFLDKKVVKNIWMMNKSSAQPMITQSDIKKFLIPLPPMSIQNEFSEIADKIGTQKKLIRQSLIKSEELFQSLLQRAFKGEL